jgi:microcystin-dependent protein
MSLQQLSYNFPISDSYDSENVIYLGNLRLNNLNSTITTSNLIISGNITLPNITSNNLFSNNFISTRSITTGNLLVNSYNNSNVFGNVLNSDYANISNVSNLTISTISRLLVSGNINVTNFSSSNVILTGNLIVNDASNINANIISSSGISNIIPIGSIFPYVSTTTLPYGYLLCNGQAISRSTYTHLFSVMGTTYGIGDGATTFNLPDLRAKIPFGASATYPFGTTGGSANQTLDTTRMATHTHTSTLNISHSHTLNTPFGGTAAIIAANSINRQGGDNRVRVQANIRTFPTVSGDVTSDTYTGNTSVTGTSSVSSFSILSPYIVLTYIIKVF